MKLFKRLLLITILLFALIRLFGFIDLFGRESLQMDFATYYTAGESIRAGFSPYKNNITNQPSIWDGVAEYEFSQHVYPPLTVNFFEFFTVLPYPVAKYIWMLLNLCFVGFSILLIIRSLSLKLFLEDWLIIGIVVALFFPLLILLERGQVDAFTLILVISAIGMMIAGQKSKHDFLAGVLWAIATLFKLSVGFVVPFLVIQKKWKVLTGYLICGLLIIFLNIGICGLTPTLNYLRDDVPRISKYVGGGTPEMRLSDDILAAHRKGLPPGFTMKNGDIYKYSSLLFTGEATIVGPISLFLERVGTDIKDINKAPISFMLLAGFVIIFLIYQIKNHDLFLQLSAPSKFMYWLSVLTVILLSAPIGTTNVVWLLPLIIIILYNYRLLKQEDYNNKQRRLWLGLCALGFFILAIPEWYAFPLLSPYIFLGRVFAHLKYIPGEIMILISLLFLIRIPPFIKYKDKVGLAKLNT